MSEEKNERVEVKNDQQETDTSVDYISAINEMKKNSVSKEAYNSLREENRKLINSLVNSSPLEEKKSAKPVYDITELRNKLFGEKTLSNLEYAKTALDLRNALIENGEDDPFLPKCEKLSWDENDINKANKVAEALQKCIDYAEGDNEVFTNELQRITVDAMPKFKRNY